MRRAVPRPVIALLTRLYRLYYATLRVVTLLPDGSAGTPAEYPFGSEIFALAERDTVALAGIMAGRRFTVLVAQGRDGDWATAALRAMGCTVVRGSSRRGGVEALVALIDDRRQPSGPAALVVDGPLGPAGVAKPGVAALAAKTGLPICALGAAARREVTLNGTWARIHIPLPFTRVALALEAVPPAAPGGRDDPARRADEVTRALARARQRAQDAVGDPPAIAAPQARRPRLLTRLATPIVWVRDLLLAALVLIVAAPLWVLPWRAAAAVGRAYGLAFAALWPLARRVGAINLARAYGPALSQAEVRRAVWACAGSLGQSIAEGIQFVRRFKHAPAGWRDLYEVEDPDLERRILDDPRPKIFVTGHLGSWEIAIALAGLRTGDGGATIARRIDNVFLNAIVRRGRVRDPSQWIEKSGAAAEALARLRRGDNVALLLDENAGYRGVFVDFFGRPASTGKIAALLSLTTGAPVIVGACVRRSGRPFLYRLACVEPSAPETPAAIAATTQAIVATLERWVRDDPWQWRWIHWRWKTRPDGTEETYGRRELAACVRREQPGSVGAKEGTIA